MAPSIRGICVLLTVGVTLHGCSSPSEGNGPSSSGPVSQSGMPTQFAQALCPAMAACCQAHNFAHDDATCRQSIEGTLSAAQLARQNLKVVYDPSAAGRCLDAYVNAFETCSDPGDTISTACHGIWVGTVEVGGACTQSQECKDTPDANASCDQGVCTVNAFAQKPARAKSGEPCNGTCTEEGANGYNCSGFGGMSTAGSCYTNDGLTCNATTKVCGPLPLLGQSCTFGGDCAPGSYCGSNSTCVAQQASGPCTSDTACTSSSYCDLNTSGVPVNGSCQPKKADGATCTSQQQCVADHCQNGICGPRLSVSASTCAGLLD